MLQTTEKHQYVPFERPWYCADEEPWPNDDPRIIDYVAELHTDDINRIRPALLDELARSDAPYSRMHTACALETETFTPSGIQHRLYLGHREETLAESGGLKVVTATEMALGKIATAEEIICGVYLTGRDLPGDKMKRVMPIPTDYDHLAKRFSQDWGPTFLIIPPDSYDRPAMEGLQWVFASKHTKAYAQHDYILLSRHYADGFSLMAGELKNHTKLSPKDSDFVLDLTEAAIKNGWTAFFTGSASGLGEITPALTDEYDDMDFIVVAEDPAKAEAWITELAKQHYGQLIKVPEVAYDTYGGKKIKGFFLYTPDGKRLIQLAIGKTMDEVCFRPDVIERNSGIWLHDCRVPKQ